MTVVHSSTIPWDELNSITERKIRPKLADAIFNSNALFKMLRDKGTLEDGGMMISCPVLHAEGPGGSYSAGETLDTSEVDQITAANFAWKFYYAGAVVNRHDELRNRGRAGKIRLVSTQLQVMAKTLRHHLGTGLHSDGTVAKDVTGLQAAITDSTDAVVYGGISKVTNPWWEANVNRTANLRLTPGLIRRQLGVATEDDETPTVLCGRQDVYDYIYSLYQPQQRFANRRMADAGFVSLQVEGRPLTVDSKAPANWLEMLNLRHIDFFTHEDENMRMEPWKQPTDQPQKRVAFMFWAGNLACSNPRFQSAFTSLDTTLT